MKHISTRIIVLVFVCLTALAAVTAAQEVQVLKPEDVERLKSVGSVTMHPNGTLVAYTVTVPRGADDPNGTAWREIHVYDRETGQTNAWVSGQQRAGSPAWSPDGSWLTFTANRGSGTQVWGLPLAGGEAVQLTHAETSVSSYAWSPDGSHIAFIARDPLPEEVKKEKDNGQDWNLVEQNFIFNRLWVENVQTSELRAVTPAQYEVWGFDWHPDGEAFLILATDVATTDAGYMLKKIYRVDAGSGERTLLHDPEAKINTPAWSPDGKKIAWHGGVDMSDASQGSLFVMDVTTGEVANLTGDADYTATGLSWLDNSRLAVTATAYQHRILFTISPDGSNMTEVLDDGPIYAHPSFSSTGDAMALSADTPAHPDELYIGSLDGSLEKVTDSNPWLADYSLGKQEVIEWTAQDGLKVQGVLIYPVNFEEGNRYPLIVQPHGGPESADLNGWLTRYSKWSQMLAGEGYFVLNPNYRGSTGRGVAYAKADHNDLGGAETQDVIDGIDYLIDKGLVDGNRVGSGGTSYGGYFSALAATKHSERYAAAIVFAGITNWFSFQGTTDISIENAYTHWNIPDWWKHPDIMWKASPVAYVENAETATFIAHGDKDLRVPLGQGQELFRTLTFKGDVPVEMVVYPRAGHGLSESQQRLDYARRAIEWFNTYVKNRKVEKDEL